MFTAVDDVVAANQPVRLKVSGLNGGQYKVTLAQRDLQLGSEIINLPTGDVAGVVTMPVDLEPTAPSDGVLIATLWDEKTKLPVAERLVFRKSAKAIKVDIKADKTSYIPGEPVKLTVTTTDLVGKPVSAVVGVTVTDDSVLEIIEKREQAPRLPVMVLLESDVQDLADAHVYLDDANPKAALATDLLLGTQGWRRFAMVKTEEFVEKYGDEARRVLALRVVTRMELEEAKNKLNDRFFALGAGAGAARGQGVVRHANGVDERRDGAVPPPAPDFAAAAKPAEAVKAQIAPQAVIVPALQDREAGINQDQPRAEGCLARRLENAQERQDRKQIGGGGRRGNAENRQDFVLVREYAHAIRPDRKPNDRVDFAETLYWNAGVKTDEKTGTGTVSFSTSDAVTSCRVLTDAFSANGSLGFSSSTIQSVQPFYVEVKMPLEVTQGDEMRLPVTLVNGTKDTRLSSGLSPSAAKGIRFGPIKPSTVNPGARVRELLYVGVDDIAGDFDISIGAGSEAYTDKVTRKLKVMPRGFPIEFARGGLAGPDGTVSYDIEIPADLVAASVRSDLALYPTPLANMTQALEALIQSPSGCFEQTSSTCYPLVMAQQYFMSHQGVDPKLIERSRTLLDDGYHRLIGFAAIPGHYTAPASRAYLYYTDEHKQWVNPLAVTINPKSE